jgi:uncharacterized protein YoxC
MEEKKTNTQLLKEMQDLADELNRKKAEVEDLLNVIDGLEIKYYECAEDIRKNTTKNAG